MTGERLEFGPFALTAQPLALTRDGEEVALRLQGLTLLRLLAERAGELVAHEEIRAALWGERHVDHARGMHLVIREVRLALGDDAENPSYIETLPRQGYRFVAPVRRAAGDVADAERNPDTWRWAAAAALAIAAAAGLWLARGTPHAEDVAPQANASVEKALYALAKGGDVAPAKSWLAEALDADPLNPDALAARAWAARLERDYESAARYAEAALAVDPRHPRALLEKGLIFAQRDWNWNAAEANTAAALAADPALADAHIAAAVIHTIRGQMDAAIAASERAYAADPVSALVRIDYGWFHYYAGDFGRAFDICSEAALLAEQKAAATQCRLKAARLSGDVEKSIGAANDMLALWRAAAPEDAALPAAIESLDEFDRVRRNRIKRLAPDFASAPEQLALAFAELGDREAALDHLDNALERRAPVLPLILRDPAFAPLHNDRRYARALAAALGDETIQSTHLR